ncbi:MAG TPA: ABC transporter permease [Gammaproteobacteria bacterium]|nr:ABC transporter permease [Gammaproteobacteria bacterium]
MAKTAAQPGWEREDSEIRLSGRWNLLINGARRKRLKHELGRLQSPDQCTWNMRDVEVLDSAGALLLWELWGRRLPERFDCREEHRRWFERLKETERPEIPKQSRIGIAIDRAGAGIIAIAHAIGGFLLLIGQLMVDVAYCVTHPRVIPWKEISATIYSTGASSMLLLGGVGFMIGLVMTIQIGMTLRQFGANSMIIGMMGLAVLRELGSVITAIILAGRSGSAITAGIGAMHITQEYNALQAFGATPSLRLVLPRVVGMAIAVPLLVVWTDFTGLLGAAITAQWNLDVGYKLFFARLPGAVPIVNFWIGLGKGVVFGLMIALVASYFGMSAEANTESLSKRTTLSVVTSLTLILIFDASSGAMLTNVGLV